jgi:hypothetical protein
MISNESLVQPGEAESLTVSFPSGSTTPPRTYSIGPSHDPGEIWSVWETREALFRATSATAVVEFLVTKQQYDIGLDNIQVSKY